MKWTIAVLSLLMCVSCAKRTHFHDQYTTVPQATTIATNQAQAVYSTNIVNDMALVKKEIHDETTAAVAESVTIVKNRIQDIHTLESPILFTTGSTFLTPTAMEKLNTKIQILKRNPDLSLLLIGRASQVGKAKRNVQLSKQRAEIVRKYLMLKGAEPGRLMVQWRGSADSVGHFTWDQAVRFQVNIMKEDGTAVPLNPVKIQTLQTQ